MNLIDKKLQTVAERLKQARLAAGYETATAAAQAMGVAPPTYAHHENGTAGLSRNGPRYAAFFRVSLDWLITGRGDMRPRGNGVPIMGLVGAGGGIIPIEDDAAHAAYGNLDLPSPPGVAALRARGDSMWPRWQDGEWVLYDPEPRSPEELANRYAIVQMADGRRLIKILARSGRNGFWRLESHNAPPEETNQILGAYRYLGSLSS